MIITETEICPTLEAGAGEGGNNLTMILITLNDQGGGCYGMELQRTGSNVKSTNGKSSSCGGFITQQSAKTRGIGWEIERSPTLIGGGQYPV